MLYKIISENITPIGDGNSLDIYAPSCPEYISENITPIGDGNPIPPTVYTLLFDK